MPDPQHKQPIHRAIAVCKAFKSRLDVLDDALFDRLDDTDEPSSIAAHLPTSFSTAAEYRRTFSLVVTQPFSIRRCTHLWILMDYRRIIVRDVNRDYATLRNAVPDADLPGAVARWADRETVAARWPFFEMLDEDALVGDALTRVCSGMWRALRVAAAAAVVDDTVMGSHLLGMVHEDPSWRTEVEQVGREGVFTTVARYFSRTFSVHGSLKQD